jgi:hypothetical protein
MFHYVFFQNILYTIKSKKNRKIKKIFSPEKLRIYQPYATHFHRFVLYRTSFAFYRTPQKIPRKTKTQFFIFAS